MKKWEHARHNYRLKLHEVRQNDYDFSKSSTFTSWLQMIVLSNQTQNWNFFVGSYNSNETKTKLQL